MRKLVLPILLFLTFCLSGQNVRNTNWLFSSDSENALGSEGSSLIFGEDKIDTLSFAMDDMISTSSTSISDSNGDLLAFSNGCRIYNNEYQLIPNGDSLSFGGWYVNDNCPFFGNVARNDNLMLPVSDSIIFLLHKKYKIIEEPILNLIGFQLLLSKINISDNEVSIPEKNLIELDNREFGVGYVHATQSEGLDGWWVSQVADSGNVIYSLLINSEGAEIVDSFNFDGNLDSAGGQGCFSPNGKIFAAYSSVGGLCLFDFDVETGQFSNHRILDIADDFGTRGCCISPNSRFGYVSTPTHMWQVDLTLDNLEDGLMLIDTFDGFGDPLPTRFSYGQLGPDCKLYFASTNSSRYLHVIHNPNQKGQDCDFKQHDIKLPHYNAPSSIPNLPFYSKDEVMNCGNLVYTTERQVENTISLFPNPTNNLLTISWEEVPDKFLVEIHNMQGHLLHSEENVRTLNLSSLKGGVYIVSVKSFDLYFSKRIVKVD